VLTVLAPGPLATIQDLGRPGWAAIGVTRSGAADRASAALANRLVGNDPAAALIEATAGGLQVRAESGLLVAVTGASGPVHVNGRPMPMNGPVRVPAGGVLALGRPAIGLRSYLAVRGGIDAVPVLGSRSTDTLSGLGPAPLAVGDRLPVGRPSGNEPVVDIAPVAGPQPTPVLRVLPGPRRDLLVPEAWPALGSGRWTVSSDSDRVGVRLTGPALLRAGDAELPSEGLVPGAIQVPPDGAPVLFLADHPVTGGYPVLAVVVTADLPAAAQLRPGDEVRFRSG
jgi:biotin-dependent carboxylase-like uncharacterized protein